MTNHDLRLKCLELAMSGSNAPFHVEGVVQRAEVLLKFVLAGDQASEVKPVPPEERGNTAQPKNGWLRPHENDRPTGFVDVIWVDGTKDENRRPDCLNWNFVAWYRPVVVLS